MRWYPKRGSAMITQPDLTHAPTDAGGLVPAPHPDALKLIPLAFGLIGLLFALIGAVALRGPRMRRRGTRATGTIVGHDDAPPGSYHRIRIGPVQLGLPHNPGEVKIRWPIVVFETTEGREIRTTSLLGSDMPVHPGRQVTVFYDPADPQRAIVDRSRARGCIGVGFVLFGGLFAVVGFGLLALLR